MNLKARYLLSRFLVRIAASDERMELPVRSGRRKAMILVLVLWIVTVMTVLAASLAFDVQVNSKLALIQREQFIAVQLARAAVAEGMTHLQNDLLLDYAEDQNQMFDSFSDVWAQPDRKENDREVELGRGTYELEVFDEEGKLPLNFANLKLYQGLLEFYDYEGEDSVDVAQAIFDFRDPDDIAGSTGEKENEYYSALVDDTFNPNRPPDVLPYQTANEPFLSIEQLLDVYGITPELYYGHDPTEEADKELRLRNNVVLGKAAKTERSSSPRRSRREVLPLKDVITVHPTGNRINVNTASAEVLTILFFAANNFGDMPGAVSNAEAIVKYRGDVASGRASKRKDDSDAFKSDADLLQVPGIDPNQVAQLRNAGALGVTLGYKSDTFRIVGIGRMGRVQRTVEVVVRRNLDMYNPEDARLSDRRKAAGAPRPPRRRAGDRSKDNLIRVPAIRVAQWIE